jgi:hypothetical protein
MPEALTPEEIQRHIETVNKPKEPGRILASATALARSGNRDAILALTNPLRRKEFLDRLDPPKGEDQGITNITRIFRALALNPSEATARVCVLVYNSEEFRELPVRINLLLGALAAVRPVNEEAAVIFRSSSAEGFAEVNAPLLLKNESPLALQVFEEIITGTWVESYVKVDILHRSVLPVRTQMLVVEMCSGLLAGELASDVRGAIIETLFDYQSRLWFGPAMYPPKPQPWESASTEVLQFMISLANRVLRGEIEARLSGPVQSTRTHLGIILQSRQPLGGMGQVSGLPT